MPVPADRKSCTGCTACVSICPKGSISMESDEYGFPFPNVNMRACVNCGLCETVCPVHKPPGIRDIPPAACGARSKDDPMRRESSSGGVFSELARAVLTRGGVVFGAAYDAGFTVVHVCAGDEAALATLRGAKYAQSHLGDTFSDVRKQLEDGRQVLFSGTPCQVAGLKAFLQKDFSNLITVDFVCHGVPSPMAWQEFIKYRAETDNGGIPPTTVNLRCKETGWSRYRYCSLFQYPDGSSHAIDSSQSLFMRLFLEDFINREACENCRFKGFSRVSDFTLGDFWGIWDILPEMDDDKGTSLVLLHSEKARKLWSKIGDRLITKEVSLAQASQQNPALLTSPKAKDNRQAVLEVIRAGNFAACEALFQQPAPSLTLKLKSKARKLLHQLAHK